MTRRTLQRLVDQGRLDQLPPDVYDALMHEALVIAWSQQQRVELEQAAEHERFAALFRPPAAGDRP